MDGGEGVALDEEGDADVDAVWGVLDGVIEDVEDGGAEVFGVGEDGEADGAGDGGEGDGVWGEMVLLARGLDAVGEEGFELQEAAIVASLGEGAGGEDAIDGAEEAVGVGEHDAVELLALLVGDGALLEGFKVETDGGDGSFELVGDGVEERVLALIAADFPDEEDGVEDDPGGECGEEDDAEDEDGESALVEDDPADVEGHRDAGERDAEEDGEGDGTAALGEVHAGAKDSAGACDGVSEMGGEMEMRESLASLVGEFRRHGAERAVVVHRGVRSFGSSYGELAELAGRFAAELRLRGIGPGERVVLWGGNSAEWIGVFFGCLLRGVMVVPLDVGGSAQFVERVLREVSPRLVVGDAALLRGLRTEMPTMVLEEIRRVLAELPEYEVSEAVGMDAAFQIAFTSGTTGEPKGVVHTHRNVLASLAPIEAEMAKYRRYERLVHPLRFLHTLPLSHVFGQFMGLWIPALLGAEVHFTEGVEAGRMLSSIRRERVSVLVAVPRVLELLRVYVMQRFRGLGEAIAGLGEMPLARRWWRFRAVHRAFGWKFWAVISGGAALPAELEGFWNALGFALIQGYGMTETAALVTLNHPFHVGRGTIGKALPGREVRLSETGEILVRGDVVSGATWQGGGVRRRQGEWLATGDLAERNEAGELRFLGRSGEAIVTSAGLNVYPADLEEAMARQKGVRQSVVVPCEMGSGVEPVAVVLMSGSDEAMEGAVRGANRELAEYQRIRRVLRWPELAFPYTATGKLLRRRVATWACERVREGREAAPLSSDEDVLLGLVSEVTGERPAAGDDGRRLAEDLHLDSLGRVQLASALEQRTGVGVDEDRLARVETLGELRGLLGESEGSVTPAMPMRLADGSGSEMVERPVGAPSAPAERRLVYPRWPWRWPVRLVRAGFLRWVMRPLVRLLGAPRVVGARRVRPAQPQLIVANHVTAYDAALVLAALPAGQRVAIAMSGEMLADFRRARGQGSALRNVLAPVGYWLVTALFNVFPLPRLRGFQRSFQHAGEAMDRGYSVLVFPEGARSKSGAMQRFRPGIGLLAQQALAPVLPVALLGLGEARRAGWVRSGLLEVRVGEVIPYLKERSAAEWTGLLEVAVRELGDLPTSELPGAGAPGLFGPGRVTGGLAGGGGAGGGSRDGRADGRDGSDVCGDRG